MLGLTVAAFVAFLMACAPRVDELSESTMSTRPDTLDLRPLAFRSEMYDREGNALTVLRGEQNREWVSLDDMPDTIKTTVVLVEDEDFYLHGGVNLKATLRATVANIDAGSISQGGSTITQQLIKNAVLSNEQELERKVLEMVLAGQLEEQMTKDEILEQYLNLVYFGNGAYGVKAAAEVYFAEDVANLTWGEAALLASLISNPSANDPISDPANALVRRRRVLDTLHARGHISQGERDTFHRGALPTEVQQVVPVIRDYFIEEVTQILLDEPILSADKRERVNLVFGGGLRIFTTYDLTAQELAEQAVEQTLPTLDEGDGRDLSMALATVEPSTGAVRAVVGGPGYDRLQYNIATQGIGRQPGSSFKTVVLLAALEAGITGKDLIDGKGKCTFEGHTFENFGNARGATASIETLTLQSSNCGYVKLGQYVGLDTVAELAAELGITSDMSVLPTSLPLGSVEVRPLDMAAAYSVIANEGVRHEPYFIERIETDSGEVLYQHQPTPKRVLSRETARRASDLLSANVARGTGGRAQLDGYAAAGKTGTTQDHADAWFVGFTPQLATSVWMGSPTARVPMEDVEGINVTGGSYPATAWAAFMQSYHEAADLPSTPFPEPAPVFRSRRELLLPGEHSRLRPAEPALVPTVAAATG